MARYEASFTIPVPEIYREATSFFTDLLIEEIHNRNYSNLKNPNNKSTKSGSFEDVKARFRIFARPAAMLKTGKRHLNIGTIEVLLFLHSSFRSKDDFYKGMRFDSPNARYRFTYGDFFAYVPLAQNIQDDFQAYLMHGGRALLESGDYASFIKDSANIVNDNLSVFKEFAQRGELL